MVALSRIRREVEDLPTAAPLEVKVGKVQFENVYFDYGPDTSGKLSNISFTINPGKTTAIVGPTGSGKSTIVRLLLRFYDVKKGSITIDGQDVREVKQNSLRRAVGVGKKNCINTEGPRS